MSDLRRQLASARNERDRLRQENAALRNIIGDIPIEYAHAYSAMCDLAYHGFRRPDDLGGNITTSHATSRPPTYSPAAYHQRNEERRALRLRAHRLEGMVDRIVDGPTLVVTHESSQTA